MKPAWSRATVIGRALILPGLWTGAACGAGFALLGQSAGDVGNGLAGATAVAEDASTIYWNPAGMSKLPAGKQFANGLIYIEPSAKFRDSGSAAALNRTDSGNSGGDAGRGGLVPNGYFAMDVIPNMKFGVGLNVPFGLKTEYDPHWLGRFQGIKAEVATLNVNPSISWKASDTLALGFGVDYQIGKIRSLTGVNYKGLVAGTLLDPAVAANAEGQNQTDVRGHAWGYNIGALFDVASNTRLGISYRSSLKYNLSGTTHFSNVPAAYALSPALAGGTADGSVNLSVKTPDFLSVSLAHRANEQWTLLAGAIWTGWNRIQSLPLVRDTGETVNTFTFNFRNTMLYAVGANYKINDLSTLRMGIAYDQSPVPNAETRTVGLPDNDRLSFSFGARHKVSRAGAVDFAYAYFKFRDTAINNIQNNPAAGQVNGNVIGTYKSAGHVLSAQYTHSF
jgi:long-chain fatty acid transport protein